MSTRPSPSKNSLSTRRKLRKNISKKKNSSNKNPNVRDQRRRDPQENRGLNSTGTIVKSPSKLRLLKNPKIFLKSLIKRSINKALRSLRQRDKP